MGNIDENVRKITMYSIIFTVNSQIISRDKIVKLKNPVNRVKNP